MKQIDLDSRLVVRKSRAATHTLLANHAGGCNIQKQQTSRTTCILPVSPHTGVHSIDGHMKNQLTIQLLSIWLPAAGPEQNDAWASTHHIVKLLTSINMARRAWISLR